MHDTARPLRRTAGTAAQTRVRLLGSPRARRGLPVSEDADQSPITRLRCAEKVPSERAIHVADEASEAM